MDKENIPKSELNARLKPNNKNKPAFGMKKYSKILMIMATILLIACTFDSTKTKKDFTITDVNLKTDDNINIKAAFYNGRNGMPSIILLHMLDGSRNDWNDFAVSLQSIGYTVISIDLRGHGESGLKWADFSESDFNKMVFDVKSAKDFLAAKNSGNKIAIIGASIGANTALNFAVMDDSVETIILLSPGLDYRGVKTKESIKKFKNPILIAASEDDSYSAESSKTLNSLSKNSVLKIYKGSLHGTMLFGKTDIDKVIIAWLNEKLLNS